MMEIKIKFSGIFNKYKSDPENEFDVLCFDNPVPVKHVFSRLMIPENLPKLILVNGIVKNKEHILQDGDILSIFPTMAGG